MALTETIAVGIFSVKVKHSGYAISVKSGPVFGVRIKVICCVTGTKVTSQLKSE